MTAGTGPTAWQQRELRSTADLAGCLGHVLGLVKDAGFTDKELFGIRLALEEALVNAIRHGNRNDPGKTARFRFRLDGDLFFVEVEDEGPGFDPGRIPDPLAPDNVERPGGRGVFLMRHYMTHVDYNERGNCVSMCKKRTGGELTAVEIPCPSCRTLLDLPADAEGRQVACPECKTVFTADAALQRGVAAGPPLPPSGRRARVTDDDDEDEATRGLSRKEARRAWAWKMAIGPGFLLIAAAVFSLITFATNSVLSITAPLPPNIREPEAVRLGQSMGILCCGTIMLVILGTIFASGVMMIRLRFYPFIFAGVVLALLMAIYLTFGVVINIVLLGDRQVVAAVGLLSPIVTITLNSLSVLLNMVAAVWTLGIIFLKDVRRSFD